MDNITTQHLANKLLAMADDELILAHRDSEWTGHAPILEEDIAFANIAQDELGHANIWYELRQALTAEEPNQVVYFRDLAGYRNAQIVELPKGDWAFSMLRQYFFDMLEQVRLPTLMNSSYKPLADAATKIRAEEIYHLRHTYTWLKRLGLGTEESNRRLQNALNELWPYAAQMFVPVAGEYSLVAADIVPAPTAVEAAWREQVEPFLTSIDLTIPANWPTQRPARSEHTKHLATLLADLQEVARFDPQANW
ncbi:MAG TPA: 1,2-phenylacetyl-CoA epoxidase subunit PaaC [Anaerolineae bacterium]|nr:1,2-phenylacetyl-CoA epoxidase subunit PaaC [Anaerolineae bacterium]